MKCQMGKGGTVPARDVVAWHLGQNAADQVHRILEMAAKEMRCRQSEHREITFRPSAVQLTNA